MNIFNTQAHSGAKGTAKAGSNNVLDVLGNHKQLTPEQAKALQKKGKLKAGNNTFETLLNSSEKNTGKKLQKETVQTELLQNPKRKNTNLKDAKLLNSKQLVGQEMTNAKNALGKQLKNPTNDGKDILNQVVGKEAKVAQQNPQGETKVARVLKLGQSKNIKATQNNPNILQEQGVTSSPNQILSEKQLKASALGNPQIAQKAAPAKNSNLVDFNTFMMKQNPQTRQRMATQQSIYTNKEKSIFAKKMDDSLPNVVKKSSLNSSSKLQDIMLGNDNEVNGGQLENAVQASQMQTVAKVGAPVVAADSMAKVFDMNATPVANNTNDVIAQIQDYAIQTKFSKEPKLDFSFKHNDLGQIDLSVHKGVGDQLNIIIGTNSAEGSKFFTQNRGELLQSLTQAGISVSDFKLDSSQKNSGQNLSQNSDQGRNTQKEHQSDSGQRQEEQQKRAELWDQLKDKEAA